MGIKTSSAIAAAVLAACVALAGCGHSQGGGTATHPVSFPPATGEKDAKALVAHCIPADGTAQLNLLTSGAARENVMRCAGIPARQRKAAAGCVLSNLEKDGTLPAGISAAGRALFDAAFPCVQKYQGGASR